MFKISGAVKHRRTIGTLVLLLLLAVTLAACGGGGRRSSEPAGTPTASSAPTTPSSTPATSSIPGSSGTGGTDDGSVVVKLANFAFGPKELRIKAGTTVTFVNEDQIAHDVVQATPATLNSETPAFQSPQIMPGSTWSHTFTTPGTYPILCTVGAHYIVGMTAEIIVE